MQVAQNLKTMMERHIAIDVTLLMRWLPLVIRSPVSDIIPGVESSLHFSLNQVSLKPRPYL